MKNTNASENEYLENIVNCLVLILALVFATWLRDLIMENQLAFSRLGFSQSRWVLVPSILYFLVFSPLVLEETIQLKSLRRFQVYIIHFLGHAILLSAMAFLFQEKTFSRLILILFLFISHIGFYFNRQMFQGFVDRAKTKSKTILLHSTDSFLELILSLHKGQTDLVVPFTDSEISSLDLAHVDQMICLISQNDFEKVKPEMMKFTKQGIRCLVYISEFIEMNDSNPAPITLMDSSLSPAYLACKRAIDILMAIPGLLVAGALYLILGPILRLQTKGSVLYTQERVGKSGRPFTLYKFRTMNVHVPKRDQDNEVSGPLYKMTNDPRVTSLGRFMRQTSLDEFPQFYNVLLGDMSLVGPRPPLPSETKQYQSSFYRRLRAKPGITGYWQIKSRKSTKAFEQILNDDLFYIQNAGILFDIYIILVTPLAMLRREGK